MGRCIYVCQTLHRYKYSANCNMQKVLKSPVIFTDKATQISTRGCLTWIHKMQLLTMSPPLNIILTQIVSITFQIFVPLSIPEKKLTDLILILLHQTTTLIHFVLKGKYDEDGNTSGGEFDDNPPISDPNFQLYDELTGSLYKDDAAQDFLGGHRPNHYTKSFPFDADPPSNFLTEDNIKNHEGYLTVTYCVDVDSVLYLFNIVSPIYLTTLIVQKKNERAVIISSRDNLLKFMLDWFNITNSKFCGFLVLLIFMALVIIPSGWYYFSTEIVGDFLLP